MPVEYIFDDQDVSALLEQNSAPPYGFRNAALIISGLYWGLTPLEQSKITTETVMAPNREFYRVWVLPAHLAYNGVAREIHTEDHVLPYLEGYVNYRVNNDWRLSNIHSHRKLAPSKEFFLNDRGEPYAVWESEGKYQPRSLTKHLKKMIDRAGFDGVPPSALRNSFINAMYKEGCGWSDLKAVTGIKQKRTLESKVRPHERELTQVLKRIYSRVKMPEHLK